MKEVTTTIAFHGVKTVTASYKSTGKGTYWVDLCLNGEYSPEVTFFFDSMEVAQTFANAIGKVESVEES